MIGGTATAQGAQEGSRPLGRVENLQFETPEPGVVRIFYDLLTDNPLLRVDVTLQVSRDGGQTYDHDHGRGQRLGERNGVVHG